MEIALSIIAIIVTATVPLWIYLRSKTKKSLSYSITSSTLLAKTEEVKGSLRLFVGDEEVITDIYLILLNFKNDGNVPVRQEDFSKDLTISTDGVLYLVELKGSEPKDLPVELYESEEEFDTVSVKPLLLNKEDEFTVKMLCTSDEKGVHISGRIAGVKDIVEYRPPLYENHEKVALIIGTVFFVGTMSLMIGTYTITETLFTSFVSFLGGFGGITTLKALYDFIINTYKSSKTESTL